MGQILKEIRCISPDPNNVPRPLEYYMRPAEFDNLVKATNVLANKTKESGRNDYQTPSVALKVGSGLKKCAEILKNRKLKSENDPEGVQTLKNFTELFSFEWRNKVSAPALRCAKIKKTSKPQLLPLTEDLLKLSQELQKRMNVLLEELEASPTQHGWLLLAEVTLARVTLFNRRRSGEAAKMIVSDYLVENDWQAGSSTELVQSLTSFEKKMFTYMKLVKVIGKRYRVVSVLLTPDMRKSIDCLLANRDQVLIPKSNPYVFSRVYFRSKGHLSGSETIRKLALQAGLKHPDRVTSTKVRKHEATIRQISNMAENETDGLAKYLGHDVRVHREFYRLTESAFQVAKVTKILLAMDTGKIENVKGKSLEEINLSGGLFPH